MTRGEQFRHCSQCRNIDYSNNLGLVCSLTHDTASFVGDCSDYKKITERKQNVQMKPGFSIHLRLFNKYLNTNIIKLAVTIFIFAIFLSLNNQSAIIAALVAFGIGIYFTIYFMKILKKSHL